jgi:hypothetical protein
MVLLQMTLESCLEEARDRLDVLAAAGQDLETSGLLRTLVQQIRKAMEKNTGKRVGYFPVGDQLKNLKNIKPPGANRERTFVGYNFVHWLVEALMDSGKYSDLRPGDLTREMPQLHVASKTSPSLVYEDLECMRNGCRSARNELKEHAAAYSSEIVSMDVSVMKKLVPSGLVSLKMSELLGAEEPQAAAAQEVEAEPAAKATATGPQMFRMMSDADPMAAARAAAAAVANETYELGGDYYGRATLTPGEGITKFSAPKAWDPRLRLGGTRLRKQHFYKPGTFNLAPAAAAVPVQASEPSQRSFFAADTSPCNAKVSAEDTTPRKSAFLNGGAAQASSARFAAGDCSVRFAVDDSPVGPRSSSAKPSLTGRRSLFLREYMWFLEPHRSVKKPTWHKCFADVRGHHLIYRHIHDQQGGSVREAAVPLPGMEVNRLDSIFASELARWLGSLPGMEGLELRPISGFAPVIFCFKSPEALDRWETHLRKEAQHPAVGNLMVQLPGKKEQSFWCVTHVSRSGNPQQEEKELKCYSNALDIIRGQEPAHSFDLRKARLQPLEGNATDNEAPRGFSLHEPVEASEDEQDADAQLERWRPLASFFVEPPGDTRVWYDVLQTLCAASALQISYVNNPTMSPTARYSVVDEDPFSKFAAQRPSCAPRGDRPMSGGPKIANLLPLEEDEQDAEAAAPNEPATEVSLATCEAEGTEAVDGALLNSVTENSSLGTASDDSDASDGDVSGLPAGDMSDISEIEDDEEVDAEPNALWNLRHLVRDLRIQTKALSEEVCAQEFTARLILSKCFGEQAPPQGALAMLHDLIEKVAEFSRDFDAAIEEVRKARDTKPKAKVKMNAKMLPVTKRRVPEMERPLVAQESSVDPT